MENEIINNQEPVKAQSKEVNTNTDSIEKYQLELQKLKYAEIEKEKAQLEQIKKELELKNSEIVKQSNVMKAKDKLIENEIGKEWVEFLNISDKTSEQEVELQIKKIKSIIDSELKKKNDKIMSNNIPVDFGNNTEESYGKKLSKQINTIKKELLLLRLEVFRLHYQKILK
jgi:hypothetical protein